MGEGREEGGRTATPHDFGREKNEKNEENSLWGLGNNIILDVYGNVTLLIILEVSHPALSSALSFPAALSHTG